MCFQSSDWGWILQALLRCMEMKLDRKYRKPNRQILNSRPQLCHQFSAEWLLSESNFDSSSYEAHGLNAANSRIPSQKDRKFKNLALFKPCATEKLKKTKIAALKG